VEQNEEYPNPWTYLESPFNRSDVRDYYGFVYKITCSATNRAYIGRKYFWQKRKPRNTAATTRRRRVTSESNWQNYYGSSDELKADVKKYGRDAFTREILSLHGTPGRVNYEETRQLFLHDVLTKALTDGTPAYYNSNILGRYYRKDYFDYHESDNTSTDSTDSD